MIHLPDPARPFEVSFMERPAVVFAGALALAFATLMALRWAAPLELALQDAAFQPRLCADGQSLVEGTRRCGFFPLREDPFWRGVRELGFQGPLLLIGLGSLLYLWPRAAKLPMTPARLAPLVVAASSLWLGSVAIINFVFKPLFGRPRPNHLEMFGGTDAYILPGSFSTQCSGNCSFVSGEASTGFVLVIFALLLPPAWRGAGIVLALLAAVLISGLRVAFGGHFLSDVIMAWWIIALVALGTAWLMQTPWGEQLLARWCGVLNRWRGVASAQV
ncbi:MAG: phosphatase PAP2 family protein [Pseudomonadota bacterium]